MPNVLADALATLPRAARSGPSTISMRPISARTAVTSRSDTRVAQVAHQPAQEPRTVLSLERDLLIVDDDGVHRLRCRAAAAAAAWPLTTALSIVAGSPVSIQSPARKKPGTRSGCPGAAARPAPPRTWRAARAPRGRVAAWPRAPSASPREGSRARIRSAPRWSVPASRPRRSPRTTAGWAPPRSRRTSNTHCMAGRGRPTNGTSMTRRSSHRLTVTIGDAARGGRGLPDRPKRGRRLRTQPIERVPRHGGRSRPARSRVRRSTLHAGRRRPSNASRAWACVLTEPAMRFDERTRRLGEQLVERHPWQRQRRARRGRSNMRSSTRQTARRRPRRSAGSARRRASGSHSSSISARRLAEPRQPRLRTVSDGERRPARRPGGAPKAGRAQLSAGHRHSPASRLSGDGSAGHDSRDQRPAASTLSTARPLCTRPWTRRRRGAGSANVSS